MRRQSCASTSIQSVLCPGSELLAPVMPPSYCTAWLACAGSSRYAKLNALHNVEARLLGAKLPCYADNPLFSRCHATQALPKQSK